VQEILQLIRSKNTFVIAGHVGPDADCVGSAYALAFALTKVGKQAFVLLEPYPAKIDVMPGRQFLCAEPPADFDVFVAVDCADTARLGASLPVFERAQHTICIDHHGTNSGFAQHNFIRATASSTAEMIFELVEQFTEIDTDIASAVYAGIVSDTGGFRFTSTDKSTMELAARLMGMGIPFFDIYSELIHRQPFSAVKALAAVLANVKLSACGRVVHAFVTRKELEAAGAKSYDLDGVVEYLMGTRGTLAAVFVYERGNTGTLKVSLRSQGPNMSAVAQALGGGGHILAAGATVSGEAEDVLAHALSLVFAEVKIYEKAAV
jgi:phosphoesterase RecJ-like protein